MIDEPRSNCPINRCVEIVGDRWSMVIMRDILAFDRHSFREILTQNFEGITSSMLTRKLNDLVKAGLLTKAEAPRGHSGSYTATEMGKQLIPVMEAMGRFGNTFDPQTTPFTRP